MIFDDKKIIVLNIAEIHWFADQISEYIDRMFIEVVMVDSIPYLKVYHVLLSSYECNQILRGLEQRFPDEEETERRRGIKPRSMVDDELRWKSGVIMDQVNKTIADSEEGLQGGE